MFVLNVKINLDLPFHMEYNDSYIARLTVGENWVYIKHVFTVKDWG